MDREERKVAIEKIKIAQRVMINNMKKCCLEFEDIPTRVCFIRETREIKDMVEEFLVNVKDRINDEEESI